jgi:hypothetical protein
MRIKIITIPHEHQRYPTVGDWVYGPGEHLTIYISDMDNWKYEFLVAFHELAEVMLCKDRGITQEQVDDFDKEYEARREEGDISEPGDSPLAPYTNEHKFATKLEQLMAQELGVDWREYDKTVSSL